MANSAFSNRADFLPAVTVTVSVQNSSAYRTTWTMPAENDEEYELLWQILLHVMSCDGLRLDSK